MQINFRPHHFLCALCFKGKGYSANFIANFTAIMNKLNAPDGDATAIHVVSHTDAICAPCPHRTGKTCTSEENINVLDRAHAEALSIQAGDELTWGEAKERIQNNITLATFHRICATCEWKPLGICEEVIKEQILCHRQ